jgi:hypothetical protein
MPLEIMDRLKSVMRARPLRVPGLSNADDDLHGTTLPERPRSPSLTVPWRSSSSSRHQGKHRFGQGRIGQDHVTINEARESDLEQESEPFVGHDKHSNQRNIVYVTNSSPIEQTATSGAAQLRYHRRRLQPEVTPHFQLDEEKMFHYEDANPCKVCKELTVDKIFKRSKTYLRLSGCQHHESGKALQQTADEGCKLCQMITKALLNGIVLGQGDHMIQWLTSKWAIAAIYLKPREEDQSFYGPVTVEINTTVDINPQAVSSYQLGLYTDRGSMTIHNYPEYFDNRFNRRSRSKQHPWKEVESKGRFRNYLLRSEEVDEA